MAGVQIHTGPPSAQVALTIPKNQLLTRALPAAIKTLMFIICSIQLTIQQQTAYHGEKTCTDTAYSFAIVNNNVTFDYKIGNRSEANRGYTAGDSIATLMLYGNDTINQSAV